MSSIEDFSEGKPRFQPRSLKEFEGLESRIVYEDNHLLGVNKWPGELAQGDESGREPLPDLIKHYLSVKYAKPGEVYLGVFHRLDQPVSGLMLFARTSKSMERMAAQFRLRTVRKLYLALCERPLKALEGVQKGYLLKDRVKNIVRVHDREVPNSQHAIQRYLVLGTVGKATLVAVEPTTGRPHQIRALMAQAGCPLLGDLKYGGIKTENLELGLHAYALRFQHPTIKDERIAVANPHTNELFSDMAFHDWADLKALVDLDAIWTSFQ